MPVLPTDPYVRGQWYLLNTGQTGGTPGIDPNVVPVWEEYSGAGVSVAVYDGGVFFRHQIGRAHV